MKTEENTFEEEVSVTLKEFREEALKHVHVSEDDRLSGLLFQGMIDRIEKLTEALKGHILSEEDEEILAKYGFDVPIENPLIKKVDPNAEDFKGLGKDNGDHA